MLYKLGSKPRDLGNCFRCLPRNPQERNSAAITCSSFSILFKMNLQQPLLTHSAFEGQVAAVFRYNVRRQAFVPSQQNYIGGLVYPVVMLNAACSSLLLPVMNGSSSLLELKRTYPIRNNAWSISSGIGAASRNIILMIIRRDPTQTFDVQLGAALGAKVMRVPCLRFHLCGEDLAFLNEAVNRSAAANGFAGVFSDADKQAIQDNSRHTSRRRFQVLVGQAILSAHRSYNAIDCVYILMPAVHMSSALLANITNNLTQLALSRVVDRTQPPSFDDLEDEDHLDGEPQFIWNFDEAGGDTGADY
jgi:hypothetical protein